MKDLVFLLLAFGLIMLAMTCTQPQLEKKRSTKGDPYWQQESYKPGPRRAPNPTHATPTMSESPSATGTP